MMVQPHIQTDIAFPDIRVRYTRGPAWLLLALALAAPMAGCGNEEAIRHYRVPKPELVFEQNHVVAETTKSNGSSGSASAGPAMSGTPRANPPARPASTPPTFNIPEGWEKATNDGFSVAALELHADDKTVRITVTPLNGTAGGFEMNVNRWRDQVGLAPWTTDELREQAEPMTVQGVPGLYIEAEGPADNPQNAIYAWLGLEQGRTWFIRLKGEVDLARRERDTFRAFLESFKFSDNSGATHGN